MTALLLGVCSSGAHAFDVQVLAPAAGLSKKLSEGGRPDDDSLFSLSLVGDYGYGPIRSTPCGPRLHHLSTGFVSASLRPLDPLVLHVQVPLLMAPPLVDNTLFQGVRVGDLDVTARWGVLEQPHFSLGLSPALRVATGSPSAFLGGSFGAGLRIDAGARPWDWLEAEALVGLHAAQHGRSFARARLGVTFHPWSFLAVPVEIDARYLPLPNAFVGHPLPAEARGGLTATWGVLRLKAYAGFGLTAGVGATRARAGVAVAFIWTKPKKPRPAVQPRAPGFLVVDVVDDSGAGVDARVRIGDGPQLKSDDDATSLAPGRYRLVVRAADGRTDEADVRVSAGQTTRHVVVFPKPRVWSPRVVNADGLPVSATWTVDGANCRSADDPGATPGPVVNGTRVVCALTDRRVHAVIERAGYAAAIIDDVADALPQTVTLFDTRPARRRLLTQAPPDATAEPAASTFMSWSITFETDRAELTPAAVRTLQDVARAVREDRRLSISVSGHADHRGTDAHNFALSEARALAVAALLRELGVRQPIEVDARGEHEPWVGVGDDDALVLDRRVSIVARPQTDRSPD